MPATTVPVRIGAHRLELPLELLVGATVRIRLPRAAIRNADTGAVVGDSGTGWEEKVLHDPAFCWDDPLLVPDSDGPESAHCMTICPECLDSWSCDWEVELVLSVEGSGTGEGF
jgi:hypothetical protein